MKLYLVQHAEAEAADVDPKRGLTANGRAAIKKIAAFLGKLQPEIAEIRHSTKLRAKQTAGIIAAALHKEALLRETEGLAPDDSVEPLARELQTITRPLLIVGHLPFLGKLASRLLCGDEKHDPIAFQNAGIVCLVKNGDEWRIEWILPPWLACV